MSWNWKSWNWKKILLCIFIIGAARELYGTVSNISEADASVKKIEADLRDKLPRKVDEATTLVDMRLDRKRSIGWYRIDTDNYKFDSAEQERTIRAQVCANPSATQAIRDDGFWFEFHYADPRGNSLSDFVVSKCA
jgi:hypothetical protein